MVGVGFGGLTTEPEDMIGALGNVDSWLDFSGTHPNHLRNRGGPGALGVYHFSRGLWRVQGLAGNYIGQV